MVLRLALTTQGLVASADDPFGVGPTSCCTTVDGAGVLVLVVLALRRRVNRA